MSLLQITFRDRLVHIYPILPTSIMHTNIQFQTLQRQFFYVYPNI